MPAITDEIYILSRDQTESARLEEQHAFFVEVTGGKPIHPSIEQGNLFAVADIATGTGAWLRDVSQLLSTIPDDPQRYYHGFDISSAQFPSTPFQSNMEFSVHDILQPFPQEHMGRYDLVNVRFLLGAIKEADYFTAINNAATLLKPNGYLQWAELDTDLFSQNKPREFPRFSEIIRLVFALNQNGMCSHASDAVYYAALFSSCLTCVTKHVYSSLDNAKLNEKARAWCLNGFSALLPGGLVRSKTLAATSSPEEVQDLTKRLLQEVKELFGRGVVPDGRFGVVVAQKRPA
ncbi:LaeA-like methyltransferase, putative [Talaromyces stipitatus ATCC 10500]|uniref:LaeA-like methyltransferase, putative n=1 Tax=Talaromyces stipitatus (strain ATCC 10500 / CBS 375.48 / QM 6759 / NRRL 1006) TaxID=441959 RepID=B8M9Y3_TALSN|nr:LaeA-like methyltransferase, putative [Talaromyces stipitatus ATCC 10500]EED18135.1 LaeA-like methyltransferase, putative [Talaromyces stipitatus ATCC 10500]